MNKQRIAKRERGASLLVALVFLVIMAMLGVTVANVTTLQERMAGNTRDRDLALQAAELALRDAENRLQEQAFRDGAIAYVATNANDDAFWQACFAGSSGPCAVKYTPTTPLATDGSGAVARQPQYVVERKPDIGATQVYRVTVLGFGGNETSTVIIQAEYAI
jgi:type IV pilus assembly protein PilX